MFNKEKRVVVNVDKKRCKKCGTCIAICDNFLQADAEGYPKAKPVNESFMGCIQCGSCMMKCPADALEIIGEDIDRAHLRPMPYALPDYELLNALFLKRRSCRNFKPDPVPQGLIDKIIDAAATAAVSIPPSEVKVLTIKGKAVDELAADVAQEISRARKVIRPFTLRLLTPFIGEAKRKMMTDFALPVCDAVVAERKNGRDILFYNAPAVMVFYGTELTDKEDMLIAATQATLAAEALGLATCFIGTAGHFMGGAKLKSKYGIEKSEKVGIVFALGYCAERYLKTFQRSFKQTRIIDR